MKHSDQEMKQPSKQQDPICPVASKMQNGHMLKKSMITSQTAETLWQAIQTITDYKPPLQACDDDTSLPDALNHFYSRFEMQNDTPTQKLPTPPNDQALCLSPADVRKTLSWINPRKAAGPENIPGRVLKDCAEQLTDIFNTSLSQTVIPTCLKSTTIIPVPKKSPVYCLNDYRPIALTPIILKCFERLVMHNIKTSLPNTCNPLQFAYRPNRSTDDAISSTLHLTPSHLENKDSYVRMLANQSSLLPFTFHHRQTLASLSPNSTMSSAATSINTLTLPLSSRGTLTKPTSRRSCRTFINMYPVLLEDRINWIIATIRLKMPTKLVPFRLLAYRTMPPFSSHRNINKGSFRNPRWRGK